MKLVYKLARDKISDNIIEAHKGCTYSFLEKGDELTNALGEKLLDESLEVRDAIKKIDRDSIIDGISDVLEVLEAIENQCGIDNSEVAARQFERAYNLGKYTKGIYLEKVED